MSVIWEEISPYFSKKENWGDYNKMDHGLLRLLKELRLSIQVPIIITCGTQGVHAPGSQHYSGHAVDIVLRGSKLSVVDELITILKLPFQGVGYYPEWSLDGEITGGWHLDVRDQKHKSTWIGITENGKRKYVGLNDLTIQKSVQLRDKLRRAN